jgi:parallel beta-helix repeat protein
VESLEGRIVLSPVVTVDHPDLDVAAGGTATNSGTSSGSGVTLTASAGTLTQNPDGTWAWSETTPAGVMAQNQTVTVTATDSQGCSSRISFWVNSGNLLPVTNTADSGPGSLRQAMLDADAQGGAVITFAITADSDAAANAHGYNSTTGVATIQPGSALPTLYVPVVIDGYSQGQGTALAASPNTLLGPCALGSTDSTLHPEKYGDNAVLKIQLDGTQAPSDAAGLTLGTYDTVQGLAVGDFGQYGISMSNNASTIQGNFIGTDVTGLLARGNGGAGVYAYGEEFIGGASPASRNIISASGGNGVLFVYGGVGTLLQGNFIGTDATGTHPLGNAGFGVVAGRALAIGGTAPGAGNVISGNLNGGIDLNPYEVIQVKGNFIGTDVTGEHAVANGGYGGIFIQNPGATVGIVVGGTDPGAGNLVSGNGTGIRIDGPNIAVQGNFIGTNVTGKLALGNGTGIYPNGNSNTIGGTTVAARNVISGNDTGIFINNASDNTIEGNYFGTDPTGAAGTGLGNGTGISIGDYGDAERNVIDGNTIDYSGNTGIVLATGAYHTLISSNTIFHNGYGVWDTATFDDTAILSNTITDNVIGVRLGYGGSPGPLTMSARVQGNQITSNTGAGVFITSSSGNTIGGLTSTPGTGPGNVISGNGGDGVLTDNVAGPGNAILGNSILNNTGNGVEVAAPGNTVGGTAPGARNLISGNGGDGVLLNDNAGAVTGVSILGNSITANAKLGIALYSANDNQAAPVLTGVGGSAASPTISGSLNSVANTTFRIEFFANPSPSNPANTEGKTLLGFIYVKTDGSGYAPINGSGLSAIPAGEGYLTATATVATSNADSTYTYGDSSEFSAYLHVSYFFGGFLPPLSSGLTFGLNRTIPIKFQLTDLSGNPVTSLSAVTSLQVAPVVNGVAGTPFAPVSTNNQGLLSSGGQYLFNWQTKGVPAGTYEILLTLADGTTHTITIQLTNSGNSAKLVSDGSGGGSGATAGALLGGDVALYVDNGNGDLTGDELARIDDAVAAVDATLAPYGVTITEVSSPTLANVTLDMEPTSAVGGYTDGVLGCTTDAGQVTLILGWNWNAGSDPSQVGSGQYDFQTVVTHELGHVLGLGHSADAGSVMYATLAPGTAKRVLATADLNVPDTDNGACGLHAALPATTGAAPALAPVGTDATPALRPIPATLSKAGARLSGDAMGPAAAGLVESVGPASVGVGGTARSAPAGLPLSAAAASGNLPALSMALGNRGTPPPLDGAAARDEAEGEADVQAGVMLPTDPSVPDSREPAEQTATPAASPGTSPEGRGEPSPAAVDDFFQGVAQWAGGLIRPGTDEGQADGPAPRALAAGGPVLFALLGATWGARAEQPETRHQRRQRRR